MACRLRIFFRNRRDTLVRSCNRLYATGKTNLVKAIYFINRKPGMSLDAFRRYWLTDHANLVRSVPGLRRYVQSHSIDEFYRSGEPVYDGIAELWYDDTAAMRRIAGTPASRATMADNENFTDLSKFGFVLTEERVVIDGAVTDSMPKLVAFLNRRPGMEVDAFQSYWLEKHAPLGAKMPSLRRYVQCHVRRSAYEGGRTPRYDGVAETWFDNLDWLAHPPDTAEFNAIRSDEKNFLASPIQFIITREHIII